MNRQLVPNPFVGLRPFERTDSLYYFGRDAQVQSLLTSLHRSRFLAVVGSSGCGKSSLIRAGLIPALEAGFLVRDRDRWRIATCKPGEAPLPRLAGALLETTGQNQDPDTVTRLADRLLEEGAEAALEILGPILENDDTNLLLLVDQFEELFRFDQSSAGTQAATHRAEAEGFVDLLLRLATRDQLPVYCVITMRSDFIGDCDAFSGLPQTINRGQFLVPRLTRVQRREAITGPVHLTGERIAPRLVDRLLNERLDTRDDLPILQHVLMRCWDTWSEQVAEQPAGSKVPQEPLSCREGVAKVAQASSPASENAGGDTCATPHEWTFETSSSGEGPDHRGPIDLEHYERVHTIHGALNRHADEALKELSSEDRDLARRLFQALTQVDPGNRRIRRPTRLSQLCAIIGADEQKLVRVIDCFRRGGRNFLVLSGDQDPMVDISHESLIRQWDSLRNWVDEEAAASDIYRRLAETAAKHTPAEPRFYRDAELQEAIAWQWQQRPTAAWAERYWPGFQPALDFLRESRLTRIEEHRERRQIRIERERERAERERLLRERAEQEQEKAKLAQEKVEQEQEKAKLAQEKVEQEQEKAKLVQEKAEQDRRARRTALKWSLGLGVLAVLMLLLAGYAFYLWEEAWDKTHIAEAAEQTAKVAAEEAKAQFLRASINLARAHEEKAIALLERAISTERTDYYQRALLQALQAQRQPIQDNPGLQPKGMDRLTDPRITRAFSGRWQSPTPQLNSTPNAIAWSPDGKQMATAQSDGSIRVWDAETGRPLYRLAGHDESVTSVAFDRDGSQLASASSDGTVRLWDPATEGLVRTLTGHEGGVWSVDFSADGNRLASASSDGTGRLWDPATGGLVRTLTGHEGRVTSVAFSADGSRLASASSDGTVRLWNPATGEPIRTLTGHVGPVTAVDFSPDGQLLASAAWDNTVRLWNPATGEPVHAFTGYEREVTAVDFSPEGKRLASGSSDGTVHLSDVRVSILLLNGSAPSSRAALISEALQRLWRLRLDGLDIRSETWNWLQARDGYYVDQEFSIDIRPAAATADPDSKPILETFNMRPLLDPPPAGKDKLDQLLDWLAEQEPRLQP